MLIKKQNAISLEHACKFSNKDIKLLDNNNNNSQLLISKHTCLVVCLTHLDCWHLLRYTCISSTSTQEICRLDCNDAQLQFQEHTVCHDHSLNKASAQ